MQITVTKKMSMWVEGKSKSLEISVEQEVMNSADKVFDGINDFINSKIDQEFGEGASAAAISDTAIQIKKDEPATDAQKKKLDELDIPYRASITKADASKLISDAIGEKGAKKAEPEKAPQQKKTGGGPSTTAKPASKAQLKYLDDLGVEYDPGISKDEASKLIEQNS